MELLTDRLLRDSLPLFRALAALLIALALAALLVLGKEILMPLALALLLSFALSPIATRLERLGLGRGGSVVLTMALAIAVVALIGYVVFVQAADLAAQLPSYRTTIRDKLLGIAGGVSGSGPFARAAEVLTELLKEVTEPPKTASPTVQTIVVQAAATGGSLALIGAYASPVLHALAIAAAVVLVTAFTLAAREDLRNRIIRLIGAEDLQRTTAALDDGGKRLGRLLLAQLAVNAAFGMLIGFSLWLIGLPSPFLWGILAGVLRFVPYIGAVLGVAPPLILAFAVDPTWTMFLWTAGFFLIFEPLVGHVIEPMLYGRSTGLSPLAVVISATVWAFLWGTVGLVLAVPLTMCLVVLGRHVSRLEFLSILLGDRPALPAHELLYQRLLAGDPDEVADQAAEVLRERSLVSYYDQVMLPGLRRAHLDIVRGAVSGERLDCVIQAGCQAIGTLDRFTGTRPKLGAAADPSRSGETEATVEQIQEQATLDRLARLDFQRTPPDRRIALLHGNHPLDELPTLMLAQVLKSHGLMVEVAKLSDLKECPHHGDAAPWLVYLSYMEPLSTLHLRAASIAVHRHLPNARVALCLWQEIDGELLRSLRARLRVAAIASSTLEAVEVAARPTPPSGERSGSRRAPPAKAVRSYALSAS
jgi:predicted PurR-regulated permease PerM